MSDAPSKPPTPPLLLEVVVDELDELVVVVVVVVVPPPVPMPPVPVSPPPPHADANAATPARSPTPNKYVDLMMPPNAGSAGAPAKKDAALVHRMRVANKGKRLCAPRGRACPPIGAGVRGA